MGGLFDGTPLEQPVTCERCGKVVAECTCARGVDGRTLDPKSQEVRVRREKRRGKWTTVVAGLDPANDLKGMLKDLRKRCAAGGAVVDGEIEIQGDHKASLVEHLRGLGYPAKGAGG